MLLSFIFITMMALKFQIWEPIMYLLCLSVAFMINSYILSIVKGFIDHTEKEESLIGSDLIDHTKFQDF